MWRRLVHAVAGVFRRAIPSRYSGRLDRLSQDDQREVMRNNFRGGI